MAMLPVSGTMQHSILLSKAKNPTVCCPLLKPEIPYYWLSYMMHFLNYFIHMLNAQSVILSNIYSVPNACLSDGVGHLCVCTCAGLTLAGHQIPTKATPSLTSSAGQGRENITTGSWVKIRTGRDHSAITIMGKTDSTWGN